MLWGAIAAVLASGLWVDGSLLTELRDGTTVGGADPRAAALSASVQARGASPEGALRLGLSPSAVLAERVQLFARGFGELELRIGGNGSARLRQALGYGTVDLSPLSPARGAETAPLQPPPGSRFVSVQESSTSMEAEVSASRRLRLGGSAAWVVSGGADADARLALPLSRGPQGRALVQWLATRLDILRLEAAAQDTRYSNDRRATVASLTAGWRTRPSRDSEVTVSLGPGIGRATAPDQPARTLAYAVAGADIRSTAMRNLSVSLGASLEPLGDALSGELIERGTLRGSVNWGRQGRLNVSARLAGSVALTSGTGGMASPRAGDRYSYGEVSALLPLDPHSTMVAGLRGALLSRPLLDQPKEQWAAFVGYAAQVPLLR